MTAIFLFIMWMSMAVILEVTGTSLLIKTQRFTRLFPSLMVAFCYMGSFYALAQTMVLIRPGLAYALWCGFGIMLIALSGFFFYRQKPDRAGMVGLGFIIAGCMMMGIFG